MYKTPRSLIKYSKIILDFIFKPGLKALIFILLLNQGIAFAVRPGETSSTAMAVTVYRAIAATDPDEKIRNPDYLAEKFVNSDFMVWKMGLPGDFSYSRDFVKYRASYHSVNARTHHIDTLLKKTVANGVKQIVNLGAGYDSRAYRFHKQFPKVKFFEVDLPATLEHKKQLITNILGSIPDYVAYVPIDFNTQTLEEVLKKAGYDEGKKTFYIMEGVTYYITEEGVNSTLKFIVQHSAPGSSIVFDYFYKGFVDGDPIKYPYAKRIHMQFKAIGEPIIFGIKEGKAKQFVNQRGLKVLSDLGSKELAQKYLVRSDGLVDGPLPEFSRIMHAAVIK